MRTPSKLHLSFEKNCEGATILRIKQQQPPWRVVRGFRTPTGELLAHLHNLSGGLLDTDSLHWQIDVAPGAQAQVTSTGATRVHRSRGPDCVATQDSLVTVGDGAYFEYLPDQLIPFAGSRFSQTTRVELHQRASLIWWDWMAPGREASGEVFQYHQLASSFELIADRKLVAVEQWVLSPQARRADSHVRLGPFRYFASGYICRTGESSSYWQAFEFELQQLACRLSTPELLWGVTSLAADGLAVRGVAISGRSLSGALVEIWKSAKRSLCGRVATLPRKIH